VQTDEFAALVEYDDTEKIFTNPNDERTEAYVTGKVG
jgi:phosphate transport system ATP-binding protein